MSVSSGGTQGNGGSGGATVSADGRYVAFGSQASNLVPGDTNGEDDIFVRDNVSGVVERMSVASDGTQANGFSFFPDISADGRYVSFNSVASNLVPGDTNGSGSTGYDVFVHDRQGGTVRVNVANDGSEASRSGSFIPSSISADGRYVAFSSVASNLVFGDTIDAEDIFVRDLLEGTTTRVNVSSTVPPVPAAEALGHSTRPSISDDGRFVAFESNASNLVAGDTNMAYDVFVHDRTTATTTRVSVASDGSEASGTGRSEVPEARSEVPAISGDGSTIAFRSTASNLVSGDTNVRDDVFVHHRPSATTTRVSVASDGTQANAGAADSNLRVAAISKDGTTVAFRSHATNLVPGDTNGHEDVFLHESGTTTRVSVTGGGTQANNSSNYPAITADGRLVTFSSAASNLVPNDTNNTQDVFLRNTQPPVLVSVGDVTIHEGDTGTRTAIFTVSLAQPSNNTVTAAYATANGSATGTDFTTKAGTLSFAPGVTSMTVGVAVAGDVNDEGDETFTLGLSSPTGAVIGDGTGVATILDDDPSTVSGKRLAIGDVSVHEGDEGTRAALFTVSLSKASTSTVTVSFATAKGTATSADFTAKSGTLTFNPGTTSLKVKVPVIPDATAEGNETFNVKLSSGNGANIVDAVGVGTILDND